MKTYVPSAYRKKRTEDPKEHLRTLRRKLSLKTLPLKTLKKTLSMTILKSNPITENPEEDSREDSFTEDREIFLNM